MLSALLWLACAEPAPVPATVPAPGKVPEVGPAAPTPRTAGSAALARIQAEIVEVSGEAVTALTPEGQVVLKLRPGGLVGQARPSATVMLECSADSAGVYTIERVLPQQGLEIDYGRVTELGAETLTITRSLGASRFLVNRWSDLPPALSVGEYLGVKHYSTDAGQAILNARRMPGRVEAAGVVTEASPGSLTVQTLGGARTWPLDGAAVGDAVIVHYTRGAAGAEDLGVTVQSGPLRFTGKHSDWDAATGTLGMVDAWGGLHGVVRFKLTSPLPAGLVPGDLADTTWTWRDGALTLVEVTERALSPVYFGRIDSIDDTSLTMTTLQRQHKVLQRAPDLFMPRPIAVGDMADVMWRREGEATIAEAIVKE